ncbi:MAG: hypothetical protein JJE10_07200 [Thermoleophilia bacterium]|nr:hypothetical protein [Thermoleophilia bacterium]
MQRIKKAVPSPAMLVAVVALVAALGGGAVAGVAVTSLNKKQGKKVRTIAKKQGKRQANKQITKKAPGLSVASATTADSATTAGDADTVDGKQANELETNSAYAQASPDNPITTTIEQILATTITTQSTKRVTAEASVQASNGTGEGVVSCTVSIAGQTGKGYGTLITDNTGIGQDPGFVGPRYSRELGPGTHQVTLDCKALTGASDITIRDVSLFVSALGA